MWHAGSYKTIKWLVPASYYRSRCVNLSEVESTSTFLQHERVLDQRESVLVEAFPLETFKVGLDQRFFSPNVLATSL